MTNSILRSVRFAFVTLLLGLTVFTVAESALGHSGTQAAVEGLSACGSEAQPCALAPIAVEAERETARLASAERVARMMLRAGS